MWPWPGYFFKLLNNPIDNNVKSLELRLALLVSQHNLAFSLPKEIVAIFKKELPNNPVLNRVSMGKTKTSNVVREGNKIDPIVVNTSFI